MKRFCSHNPARRTTPAGPYRDIYCVLRSSMSRLPPQGDMNVALQIAHNFLPNLRLHFGQVLPQRLDRRAKQGALDSVDQGQRPCVGAGFCQGCEFIGQGHFLPQFTCQLVYVALYVGGSVG